MKTRFYKTFYLIFGIGAGLILVFSLYVFAINKLKIVIDESDTTTIGGVTYQTYKNLVVGFSLEYPASYIITWNEPEAGPENSYEMLSDQLFKTNHLLLFKTQKDTPYSAIIIRNPLKNQDKLTAQEWGEKNLARDKKFGSNNLDSIYRYLNINGTQAAENTINQGNFNRQWITYYFVGNKIIPLKFVYYPQLSDDQNNQRFKIYEIIRDSFETLSITERLQSL